MAIWARRAAFLALSVWTLLLVAGLNASAQTPTPTPAKRDCSSFATQEQAQQFFDQNGGKTGAFKDLDVDGDGKACEGLPSSGAAVATPVPVATATPGTNTLPKNGAGTVAMALSGFTFLEAGYGLMLLARRVGVRSRALPVYLMRKLVRAAREGRHEVELTDDVFLVRRSSSAGARDSTFVVAPTEAEPVQPLMVTESIVLEPGPMVAPPSHVNGERRAEPAQPTVSDDAIVTDTRPIYAAPSQVTGGRVYATLARTGSERSSEPSRGVDAPVAPAPAATTEAPAASVDDVLATERDAVAKAVKDGDPVDEAKGVVINDPEWPFFTPPS
jgi:hypothetical protein